MVRRAALFIIRMGMKITSGLLNFTVVFFLAAGCASQKTPAGDQPPAQAATPLADVPATEISEGYALLFDLVSKEKHSNLISLIKKESPEFKAVLKKISDASRETARELETISKSSPPLNLKATHLPKLEQRTRDLIDKETGGKILHSSGLNLEFLMLMSQVEGMNYAAYLARSLQSVEVDPRRREFLTRTERKFSVLRDEINQSIFIRYTRGTPPAPVAK